MKAQSTMARGEVIASDMVTGFGAGTSADMMREQGDASGRSSSGATVGPRFSVERIGRGCWGVADNRITHRPGIAKFQTVYLVPTKARAQALAREWSRPNDRDEPTPASVKSTL